GWGGMADEVAKRSAEMNAPFLELIAAQPGERILDLASGAGEPAMTLARQVAPEGRVTASDLSSAMLREIARRAEEQGIANLETRVADMEALPFDAGAFDAVTSRFGLMFAADLAAVAAETFRVLKPGGRAVHKVWGPRENVDILGTIFATTIAELELVEKAELIDPFALGAPGSVAPALEAAGFTAVEERDVRLVSEIAADRPFWRPMLQMSCAAELAALDAAGRERLEQALEAAFAPYREGEVYRLGTHIRLITGRKPA
ncbi:MAG: class I SAM-dependent methyltransferase, partial [Chromatiales bacterium]